MKFRTGVGVIVRICPKRSLNYIQTCGATCPKYFSESQLSFLWRVANSSAFSPVLSSSRIPTNETVRAIARRDAGVFLHADNCFQGSGTYGGKEGRSRNACACDNFAVTFSSSRRTYPRFFGFVSLFDL